jgi:hypothetical protein
MTNTRQLAQGAARNSLSPHNSPKTSRTVKTTNATASETAERTGAATKVKPKGKGLSAKAGTHDRARTGHKTKCTGAKRETKTTVTTNQTPMSKG